MQYADGWQASARHSNRYRPSTSRKDPMSRSDIIVKEQDLTYLSWNECFSPSGLGGTRAKAREGRGCNAVYYKRSRTGALGRDNRDLVAQLVGARLADALGFEHAPFQLVRAYLYPGEQATWVVRSKSYRKAGERAVSIEDYLELCGDPRETPLEFFARRGWGEQAAQTLFFDYLTATRDRDASCFEVLLDAGGSARLSPLALRSMSLANAFPLDSWRRDPCADIASASFLTLGSQSDNLAYVARILGVVPKPHSLKKTLLGNLSEAVDDPSFLEGCFEIVNERWDAYARICNL